MRRSVVVVTGVGILAALAALAAPLARGQARPKAAATSPPRTPAADPPAAGPVDPADLPGATLPVDPRLKRKLEAAGDYIRTRDWAQVARTLQELLDLPQDVFVQVTERGPNGKEVPALVGIRAAANRLLGTLPPEGLDVYRTLHGAAARKILQQAVASGDQALFDEVTQRYLYTDAGAEAAERLGTLHLDRGRFIVAARAFEKLIQRDGVDKLEPLTLFKAALAFHRSGDREGKDRVWKRLAARSPDGLRVGDQTVGLDELEKLLDRYRPSETASVFDHLQFGGTEGRNAQGVGGAPFLVRDWSQPLTVESQTKRLIYDGTDSAVGKLESRGKPVLPALFPIAATVTRHGTPEGVLVFRTYAGVSAVDMRTGKLRWNMPSSWSIDTMLSDSQKAQAVNQWVNLFINQVQKPNVLLENSTVGSLSCDNARVYVVEDLAVPPQVINPFDGRFGGGFGPGSQAGYFSQAVNDAVSHSKLRAIDLVTGKLKWELGAARPAGEADARDPRDLSQTYFLGPPLCLGGKLYFLNEKQQELRLVCFDPNRLPDRPTEADKREAVVWVQTLCTAKEKILQDYARRINAAHIAYGEGILVCPTNASVLLGVDVLSHSLVWAHPYREGPSPPAPPYGMDARWQRQQMIQMQLNGYVPAGGPVSSDWKASAPVVQDGKVVFTAPDGGELRCLNLRNGTKVWGLKRQEDDLYLAGVFAGRVVIVGKKYVRAVSLEDGSRELWRVETGIPSGRGVASENVYYVPLREAVGPDKERGPAVVAIDVEKGRVVAHTRSRSKDVPGNLVFFDGRVISQTAAEVVAYPQLKVQLAKMNDLIRQNPRDPNGLYLRGELRLDEGNLAGAVEDLRQALANGPADDLAGRARAKLYDALTELLQHDFTAGEKYLKEYEALCRVPVSPDAPAEEQARQEAEGRRRRAGYLALYARGKESQGKLAEAFDAYLEFGALGGQAADLLSVPDEPAVRAPADVWARGRIAALIERAGPAQRRPLEEAIARRWAEVRDSADLDRVRQFVALFGPSLPVGREARLHLAERLMEQEGKAALLDAERHLLTLERTGDDPQTAARAVEALARLMTRKGLLEDAAHFYRVLRDDYGEVVVRDGKTGAALHEELATDKRFLPYLEEPAPPRGRRPKGVGEYGNFPQTQQHMVHAFEAEGETLPFLQRHRLALHYANNHLRMTDRRTGEDRWSAPLKPTYPLAYARRMAAMGDPSQAANRFTYQAVGHLVVLDLGDQVVALDPINQKVLWERSLLGSQGAPSNAALQRDAEGVLWAIYNDGHRQRLGQAGPVAASYVCLQGRDGLTALDPLTGRTLWVRGDVSGHCRLFGDDRHVYVVELDTANGATGSRAFRAQDGAAVAVPDFAAPFQNQVRVLGRVLLLSERSPTAGRTMRLYDVPTGKDVWAKSFPADAIVLQSQEPDLAGVIAPDGRLTVISLRTRKEVLVGLVDPRHLERVQQAHLLDDGQFYYVAFHTRDANQGPAVMPNLQAGTGLRGLTVHGAVYAFDRATGKIRWVNEVANQQLVLEQWKEMPILLFTARYHKQPAAGGRFRGFGGFETVGVEAYEKATGKTTFYSPELGQQVQPFYALNNDLRNGKIELISRTYKVTHTFPDQTPAAGGDGEAAPAGGPAGPPPNDAVPTPGRRLRGAALRSGD